GGSTLPEGSDTSAVTALELWGGSTLPEGSDTSAVTALKLGGGSTLPEGSDTSAVTALELWGGSTLPEGSDTSAVTALKLGGGSTAPDSLLERLGTGRLGDLFKAGDTEEALRPEHWDCNDWSNCPMAALFGVSGIQEIADEWQRDAMNFVALYDAGQVTRDMAVEAVGEVSA
ncbi:MAG: hypothetical protein AAGI68_11865, partial [Planctomycetota bacterium]